MVDTNPEGPSPDIDVSLGEHRLTPDDVRLIIDTGHTALAGSRAGESSRLRQAELAQTRLQGVKGAILASQTGWFGFSWIKR